ncbi:TetR/AcrR family transcriptional regulator [Thermaerobacter litoralis]
MNRPGDDAGRRIRQAATGLFRERGYRGTGLRQVAAAAGVAVGTVYAHFPDKPSLLRAVTEEQAARLSRQLARVHLTPGLPAAERWLAFRRVLEEALPWLACEAEAGSEAAAAPRPAAAAGPGGGTTPAGPVWAAVHGALARFLAEGARRGEVRLLGGFAGAGGGPGGPPPLASAGEGREAPALDRAVGAAGGQDPGLLGGAERTARAVLAAALGLWQAGCATDLDWLWHGLGNGPDNRAGAGEGVRAVVPARPGWPPEGGTGTGSLQTPRVMPVSTWWRTQ